MEKLTSITEDCNTPLCNLQTKWLKIKIKISKNIDDLNNLNNTSLTQNSSLIKLEENLTD